MEFHIREADFKDIDKIMLIMENAVQNISDISWFVADDRNFIKAQIESDGFVLIAETEYGDMAGFLVIRFPGLDEANLGSYMKLEENELKKVVHMESAAVWPNYRGNGLQLKLMEAAEKRLEFMPYEHMMGTVHPGNLGSLKSFRNRGYRVASTVKKYGDLDRHILYKHKCILVNPTR